MSHIVTFLTELIYSFNELMFSLYMAFTKFQVSVKRNAPQSLHDKNVQFLQSRVDFTIFFKKCFHIFIVML